MLHSRGFQSLSCRSNWRDLEVPDHRQDIFDNPHLTDLVHQMSKTDFPDSFAIYVQLSTVLLFTVINV